MPCDLPGPLLASLPALSFDELRAVWRRELRSDAPKVSAALLRLGLAHDLQVKVHGDLPKRAQRQLAAIAGGKPAAATNIRPGMRLVREWNGEAHVVSVGEDNIIRWNDREWTSLSAVARAITGTRWSGPAFFGLKNRKAAA